MPLPKLLPSEQGQFAVTAFDRGDVVHNGDVLTRFPTRPGFHAVFHPKTLSTQYVGPFETAKEAYSVGLSWSDFSKVIKVK